MEARDAPIGEISRQKRLLFSLILVAMGVLLFFAAEALFRYWHGIPIIGGRVFQEGLLGDHRIFSDDLTAENVNAPMKSILKLYRRSQSDILLYELREGYSDGEVSINSHGFRDREYSLEKPNGTYRIAALGDSILWGHGLPLEMAFTEVLEGKLNALLDREYEVLNFAVTGYNTVQEAEVYRIRAKGFDPDLIILGYCLNDYRDDSPWEMQPFRLVHFDLLTRSYLLDDLKSRLVYVAEKHSVQTDMLARTRADIREGLALLKEYSGDTEILMVLFPYLRDLAKYKHVARHLYLRETAEELGFHFIDLLETYGRYDPVALRLPIAAESENDEDYLHPNELGHRLAAQATFEFLVSHRILSETRRH